MTTTVEVSVKYAYTPDEPSPTGGPDVETTVVEVPPELAAELERLEWRDEKREQRRRKKETGLSKVGVVPNNIPDPKASSPARDYDDEYERNPGEYYETTLLYGESIVWDALDVQFMQARPKDRLTSCRFCGHLPTLSPVGYCLECDRHGQDARIPKGHPKRPSATKYDGTAGKGVIETPEPKGRRRAG